MPVRVLTKKKLLVSSSYGFFTGITRQTKDGKVLMTLHAGQRIFEEEHGWTVTHTRYVWDTKRSGWRQISTRDVHITSERRANELVGWHVKGLPNF
ncbi:hypothetical protein [Kineosporia succinea]|uniref:Uncharacterized protein n=1 Tax=Kineosporia succinea TaxID=84632 RepID=A0ABT9P4M6_9ACTN|nr:hypothetical protein [Kineosporia succinea]MDP9827644.1 hypothetical protein [Kineosporia succinea]